MPRIIGSEKQKYGTAVYTVVIDPGAVAAGTNIPLPTWAKGAQDMLQCILFHGTTDEILDTGTPDPTSADTKTVVAKGTATPGPGEACLYDANNIRLGDATRTNDILFVTLIYKSFTVEL